MANQSQATKATMTLADVRDAIKRGDFKMDELVNSLADEKAYVRAGNDYRELVRDGVSVVRGQFANCYKLGDRIDTDGNAKPKRSRKKKQA